jgi:DNA replication licensing factor MCM5
LSPPPQHKANVLVVQCKHCHALERVPCRPGLGGALVPGRCNTYDGSVQPRCPPNPYVVVGERCEWVDQQTLKLQVGWGARKW